MGTHTAESDMRGCKRPRISAREWINTVYIAYVVYITHQMYLNMRSKTRKLMIANDICEDVANRIPIYVYTLLSMNTLLSVGYLLPSKVYIVRNNWCVESSESRYLLLVSHLSASLLKMKVWWVYVFWVKAWSCYIGEQYDENWIGHTFCHLIFSWLSWRCMLSISHLVAHRWFWCEIEKLSQIPWFSIPPPKIEISRILAPNTIMPGQCIEMVVMSDILSWDMMDVMFTRVYVDVNEPGLYACRVLLAGFQ